MSHAVLTIKDGRTWQNAEIPPYEHPIAPYGTAMAGLPSKDYGGWQKIHHAIPPRRHHGRYLTTLESQESMLISHNHIYILDLARPRSIEVQFPHQIPVTYKAMNNSQHNCISTK